MILEGLPSEYDPFTISINTRVYTYTVEEIEALLMAQESKIEKQIKSLDSAPIAFMAQISNSTSYSPNYGRCASERGAYGRG